MRITVLLMFALLSFQVSAKCNKECDAEYKQCSEKWEGIHPSCGPKYKKCLAICPPPGKALNVCTKDCYDQSYACKKKWEGIHPGCEPTLKKCLKRCP